MILRTGIFHNRPALNFLAPFVGGIIAGWYFYIPRLLLLSIIILLYPSLILVSFRRASAVGQVILCWATIFTLGELMLSTNLHYQPEDSIATFVKPVGESIELRGTIADISVIAADHLGYVVEADSLVNAGSWRKATGTVSVTLYAGDEHAVRRRISYGSRVDVRGILEPIARARNPFEFDPARYAKLNGIDAHVVVYGDSGVIRLPGKRGIFYSVLIDPVRSWISLTVDSLIGGEEGALLK